MSKYSTSAIPTEEVFGAGLQLQIDIEKKRLRKQDELIDAYINRPFKWWERLLFAIKNEKPWRVQGSREYFAGILKKESDETMFGGEWWYASNWASSSYEQAEKLCKLCEASLKSNAEYPKVIQLTTEDAHLLRNYL